MAAWLVWVIAGLLLVSAEVLSGDLWLLMIGLGALGGAVASAVGGDIVVSAVVFAVATIALLGGIRPVIKRRMFAGDHIQTNTQALIGAKATVVSVVDGDQGQVKIGGEIWSARAHNPHNDPFVPGTPVIVVEISGATAVVAPIP